MVVLHCGTGRFTPRKYVIVPDNSFEELLKHPYNPGAITTGLKNLNDALDIIRETIQLDFETYTTRKIEIEITCG